MPAGEERAVDIAAHGNHNVDGRNVGEELAALAFGFHVDVVEFLHEAHRILVDFRLCLGACGIAFKDICGKVPAKGFGNLASAGIMNTYKGDFLHGKNI